jgi:hypothetical protein
VLGGWFGVLPAILLHDARFNIAHVTSLDINPRCERVALALNDTHVRAGKFTAVTADMLDRDYARGASAADEAPKLIVKHELRARRGVRSLVWTHTGRSAAGAAEQRLFRVQRARQLRAGSRNLSNDRRRCAMCSTPASASFAVTCASC